MNKTGVGLALLAVCVILLGVGLGAYLQAQYTVCHGAFASRAAAERAADTGDADGLDTSSPRRSDGPASRAWAVAFETSETGDDAAEARRRFRRIVRREGGELGHPDGGCLERGHFE